jgi:hypothetical protein
LFSWALANTGMLPTKTPKNIEKWRNKIDENDF